MDVHTHTNAQTNTHTISMCMCDMTSIKYLNQVFRKNSCDLHINSFKFSGNCRQRAIYKRSTFSLSFHDPIFSLLNWDCQIEKLFYRMFKLVCTRCNGNQVFEKKLLSNYYYNNPNKKIVFGDYQFFLPKWFLMWMKTYQKAINFMLNH